MAFLGKSKSLLSDAAANRGIGLPHQAGRLAYSSGHQAAMALIFEWTGKIVKTHNGANSEFGRLIRGDQRFGPNDRSFLSRNYELKQTADYDTGDAAIITDAEAADAIAEATHLIETIESALQETTKETPP